MISTAVWQLTQGEQQNEVHTSPMVSPCMKKYKQLDRGRQSDKLKHRQSGTPTSTQLTHRRQTNRDRKTYTLYSIGEKTNTIRLEIPVRQTVRQKRVRQMQTERAERQKYIKQTNLEIDYYRQTNK